MKYCALFRAFDASDLNALLELAEPRLFPAGMEIVLKGDEGRAMFIVAEGEAQAVIHTSAALDRGVSRFKAGDFFGEMALLKNERYGADVVAVTDCTVLTITTVLMRMLGHSFPQAGFRLAMAVLGLASHGLRSVDQRSREAGNVVSLHANGTRSMACVA